MYRLVCIALLFGVAFAAQTTEFENSWAQNQLFNIISATPSACEIVFSMHKMVVDDAVIDGVPVQSFGVPAVFLPDPGVPNLTGANRFLAIPRGARAELTIIDYRTEVHHNIEVGPAPNIPSDTDDQPLRYEKNMDIYGRNAHYPSSPVVLSEPFKIRGVDVVQVGVVPFQYNPMTKELIVYKDIRFRIDFVGGSGHFGEDRLRSRFWEHILQGHLINYSSLPKIDFYSPSRIRARSGVEYIIIVPDDPVFEAWGDTIKAWRKLQGISCDVFTLTEVGGSTAADIENFLNDAYNTWDPAPVAFLLLSDYPSSGRAYGITSPVWNSHCISDNIYADVDEDDLPDMHHARICAQHDAHLNTMINKFLSYERNPYTSPNFYDNPLVACGWQDDRWFQLASEVVRGYLINELSRNPAREYNHGSPATISPGCAWSTRDGTAPVVDYWHSYGYIPLTNPYDATWWNNGSAAGVNAAINSGAFFVQHRDHGSTDGWGEPDYGRSDLDSLTNTEFTFVNSTNCLTGKYNNASEVFAEKFHRIDYGCWGINAASEVSYSFVNDTYIWGMWDCFFSDFDPGYPLTEMTGYDVLRPCMAMTYGKFYLRDMWFPDSVSGASSYRPHTYHLFHHHSDAFVTLYSQIPDSLTVVHDASLDGGVPVFTVTADDSSVIALTVNGEIIGVAEGTGAPVDIPIEPQTPGSIMLVTVTKANYYRYEAEVPVVSSDYPYVMFLRGIIDDATGNNDGAANPGEMIDYGVWAKNVGTGTAQSIYGLLSESDAYVTLSIDSSWYGDIPQDDSALSSPYYQFNIASDCPDGHVVDFTLNFHDINDSIFTSYPEITVHAPVLVFVDVNVVNDANSNGILDPDETADLVVTIENQGSARAENVTSTLTTDSPYITITDDSGNYGSIAPDSTADNAADPYTVYASDGTPTGTRADFEIEVVSGVYVDTLGFSLVIGQKHYYVWNPDPTPAPGQNVDTILTNLGYVGDYGTALAPDLSLYQSVFVCVGIYSNNYVITNGSPEAAALVDYINNGGKCYMEGGDLWYWDPNHANGYNFGPLFGISPVSDGTGDLGPVVGESGTFTNSMNFAYGGENNYIDHINPTGTGFLIFHDGNNSYNCGVANDAGTYRTVGTSFELGLLTDATPPSTREALLDSIMIFFGIGSHEEVIPPSAPVVTEAAKAGNDVQLAWNTVTTDTAGNPETMDCYIIYRDTTADFIPAPDDSIGATLHPETTYTDAGALLTSASYYYIIKAVNAEGRKSSKSNMAFKFNASFNENPAATDKNWTSLPWDNAYSTVSDLADDLSPAGDPLTKITNLRDDQNFESWIWDDVFLEWNGTNFAIVPGRAYEMTTIADTALTIAGCNDPDGLVSLNENASATDKNWVSIPYNADYTTVSDITDEYSPSGDPLVKLTELRDDQFFESWIWDDIFSLWNGTDFAIERGRGYEMVTIIDTTWNPTEYTNGFGFDDEQSIITHTDATISLGTLGEPARRPAWQMAHGVWQMAHGEEPREKNHEIKLEDHSRKPNTRSLVVRTYVDVTDMDDLVFTVYRAAEPHDVITEQTIGSGILSKDDRAVIWFDAGNFANSWSDGDKLIMIIEATNKGAGQYAVLSFCLNACVDIQDLGSHTLAPIPQSDVSSTNMLSRACDNPDVIGYSLYREGKRINQSILTADDPGIRERASVRLVIRGGFETVHGSQGTQSGPQKQLPIAHAFSVAPNPFTDRTGIAYALPCETPVTITVYDVSGRQVKALVAGTREPGYYHTEWCGDDASGRMVPAGIYFVQMQTGEFESYSKIVFLR